MTKSRYFEQMLIIAYLLLRMAAASSQENVAKSVLANGGAASSDQNFRLSGTLGQAVIGRSSNANNVAHTGFWYQAIEVTTSVEKIEDTVLPKKFWLAQNYPNPFNPGTTIRFDLPERTQLSLRIFDLHGRQIIVLHDGEMAAGVFKIYFESAGLPSGIYFCRMHAKMAAGKKNFVQTRKLTLLK